MNQISFKKPNKFDDEIMKIMKENQLLNTINEGFSIFSDQSYESNEENKENIDPKTPPRSSKTPTSTKNRKKRSSRRISRIFSFHKLDDSIYEEEMSN